MFSPEVESPPTVWAASHVGRTELAQFGEGVLLVLTQTELSCPALTDSEIRGADRSGSGLGEGFQAGP
jgi:hypothetical protein